MGRRPSREESPGVLVADQQTLESIHDHLVPALEAIDALVRLAADNRVLDLTVAGDGHDE